jgi:hypothetical protein
VTDLKGKPLEDVKISLDNHPMHVVQPAKFTAVLPIGTYRLAFSVDNHETKERFLLNSIWAE